MDWNDLKVFLAIARAGTLAGAARTLGMNHSTVFRRLNRMESDLGVALFNRQPDGYVLTPAGERMAELGRQADQTLQQIERELAGRDIAPAGKVRVTTAPNIAHSLLPPLVLGLRRTHPEIVVEISVGDADYDLNRREADIALRATTRPPAHLIGRKVMSLDWWIHGAGSGSQAVPNGVDELAGFPLIGADAAMLRVEAFQWLESTCADSIVALANDLTTMAELAATGLGLALLPSDQQSENLRRLFKVPHLKGELWLLTHPDLREVRRIRVVWDALLVGLDGA